MNTLLTELETRWHNIFSTLKAGGDVAPGLRLRTEGLMEAMVLSGAATSDDVSSAMEACYLEVFNCSIAQDFEDNWRVFFPFPQIPAMGRRAPVYPSTPD
ncbi:MAG: hypothetical protein ACI8QT_000995 [Halioglobus sp.]|jgi:hypothetical protein